jgi:ribonuclease P protein component
VQRLRRKADIARVFREGRRFSSPAAVLHTRLRAEAEPVPPGPRLTIIAGRRFSGAVARNRARRLLRETARLLLARVAAPWDLLLVARTEVLALPYQLRRRLLSELFCQAGVVAEEVAAA